MNYRVLKGVRDLDYEKWIYGPIAGFPALLLGVLVIWVLFWKGLSLWKAAKNNQSWWFVVLLVLSTAGILEIIYLAFFQKKRK